MFNVCLFVGKSPGSRPHLVCKVDDVVDIDARQVNDGIVGIRVGAPHVLVMIYNTRALLLEDFVRLLRKLTERRKIGTAVRFRYTPEQVLESQRIEREQTAAVTNLQASSSANGTSVFQGKTDVLGSLYMPIGGHEAAFSHAVHHHTHTSPGGGSRRDEGSETVLEEPLKIALNVSLLALCDHICLLHLVLCYIHRLSGPKCLH